VSCFALAVATAEQPTCSIAVTLLTTVSYSFDSIAVLTFTVAIDLCFTFMNLSAAEAD